MSEDRGVQGIFGGYSRELGWLLFYILEDRVGLAGEGCMALSQRLRGHSLWKKSVVFVTESFQGETYLNFGVFGSLLIFSVTLCKEHSFAANGMVLKLLLTLLEVI